MNGPVRLWERERIASGTWCNGALVRVRCIRVVSTLKSSCLIVEQARRSGGGRGPSIVVKHRLGARNLPHLVMKLLPRVLTDMRLVTSFG